MELLVALIVCLSIIQITAIFSVLEDNIFDVSYTGGVRLRRGVKSAETLAMLEKLPNTTGWEHLDPDSCGKSSVSVHSRRRRRSSIRKWQFNVTTRIYGGTEVKPGQYPWMAQIFYQAGPALQLGCGGAVLSQWHVLTAAHCITPLPKGINMSSIKVGSDENPQSLSIANAYYHSGYQANEMQNDIAILKVATPIVFDDYVAPVCLPLGELAEKNFDGQSAVVAGWGRTETARSSQKLLMVNIPVMANSRCRPLIANFKIRSSHICAGGDKGKDSCNGDSGGPLFLMDRQDGPNSPLRYTIIGVVSFGPNQCGSDGTPGVYTRVTYFLPWILANMN